MKSISWVSLILFVSSVLAEDEYCDSNYSKVRQICYRDRAFTRIIELEANSNEILSLYLWLDSNNTIAPYAFNNSHTTAVTIRGERMFRKDVQSSSSLLSLWKNSFAGMSEVEELVLDYVIIDFHNENPLAPLGSLKVLGLQDVNLNGVPMEILASVPKLEKLNLEWNLIRSIHSNSFASLKNLKRLDLSYNGITHIEPGAFNGLVELKELILYFNNLLLVPGSFQGMPRLNVLYLKWAFDHNASQLQVGIFDGLSELTTLNLEGNRFKDIPTGVFEKLTSLKDLDLSHNRIEEIALGVFENVTALKNINLRSNKIRAITPGTFDGLSLHTLILQRNKINFIETDTFNVVTIRNLQLDDNAIVELKPRAFNGLTVDELDLKVNNLSKIDANDFLGVHSKFLNLGYNKIVTIDEGAFKDAVTEKLYLHHNPIEHSINKAAWGLPESVEVMSNRHS